MTSGREATMKRAMKTTLMDSAKTMVIATSWAPSTVNMPDKKGGGIFGDDAFVSMLDDGDCSLTYRNDAKKRENGLEKLNVGRAFGEVVTSNRSAEPQRREGIMGLNTKRSPPQSHRHIGEATNFQVNGIASIFFQSKWRHHEEVESQALSQSPADNIITLLLHSPIDTPVAEPPISSPL